MPAPLPTCHDRPPALLPSPVLRGAGFARDDDSVTLGGLASAGVCIQHEVHSFAQWLDLGGKQSIFDQIGAQCALTSGLMRPGWGILPPLPTVAASTTFRRDKPGTRATKSTAVLTPPNIPLQECAVAHAPRRERRSLERPIACAPSVCDRFRPAHRWRRWRRPFPC